MILVYLVAVTFATPVVVVPVTPPVEVTYVLRYRR